MIDNIGPVRATVYEDKTGMILASITAPDKETVMLQPVLEENKVIWGEASDPNTQYISKGNIVPRPEMKLYVDPGLEVGIGEVITVRNIPRNTVVTYPGGTVLVTDGYITWSTRSEGDYVFTFKLFPYKEEEINARVR